MNDIKYRSNANYYFGFTLIEMLIALVISSLVLTAVHKVFISNNIIYLKQSELIKIEQNMRSAMNLMMRDIRMAGYNSTNDNVIGIGPESNSTNIMFDYENDFGDIEDKEYYFDNNQKRIENKSGISIANNIGNLDIKYCNGTQDTDCYSNYVTDTSIIKLSIEPYTDKSYLSLSDNLSMKKTVYIRNACLNE